MVADRFAEPEFGKHIKLLEAAIMEPDKRPDDTTIKAAANRNQVRTEKLTDTLKLPEVSKLVGGLSAEEFKKFAADLKKALDDKNMKPRNVADLITKKHRSLTP